MDLFNNLTDNILPYDGEVIYYGPVIPYGKATTYFNILMKDISWQHDEAIIFGKRYVSKRKVAWYGDESYSYTYSNATKHALPWTKELLELKKIAEEITGTRYNSCLLNLYHDGDEAMAWHSDDEKSLGKNTVIASLSLGAARKFGFKHKETKEKREATKKRGKKKQSYRFI